MALVTLKDILKDAQSKKYGVGMFNALNLEMARGIIGAAEEERAPVILAMAEVHIPYGDLKMLGPILVQFAKEAKVPVAVHFDHGMDFRLILKAMQLGFTSVMYDGSTLPYEENLTKTKEIVKIASALGVSVEAELGHVGGAEGGAEDEYEAQYTKPEQAIDFTEKSGIDALAVAIGTAHGTYKVKPKLDINRLHQIQQLVSVPLVLHGGSGLTDEDFKNSIANGISKVNVFTDMSEAVVRALEHKPKKASYPDIIQLTMEAVKEEVASKIRLFGGSNRG